MFNSTHYYEKKIAFIVGGSDGIGLAIASLLVQKKTHVIIFSRQQKRLHQALSHLRTHQQFPTQIIQAVSLDATHEESCQTIIKQTVNQYGTPFFLFNCAGIARAAYTHESNLDDVRNMIDINYLGTYYVTHFVLMEMLKKHSGHIINVSSMAGFIGLFGYSAYCASKYAVMGFSHALKNELSTEGISVSVLCPPNTQTKGLEEENKTKPQEVLKTEEQVKVLSPELVAQKTLRAVARKKYMIIPSFDGSLAYWLSRYCPKILQLFTQRKK